VILLAKCQRGLLLLFSLKFGLWRGVGQPLAGAANWASFPTNFADVLF